MNLLLDIMPLAKASRTGARAQRAYQIEMTNLSDHSVEAIQSPRQASAYSTDSIPSHISTENPVGFLVFAYGCVCTAAQRGHCDCSLRAYLLRCLLIS